MKKKSVFEGELNWRYLKNETLHNVLFQNL